MTTRSFKPSSLSLRPRRPSISRTSSAGSTKSQERPLSQDSFIEGYFNFRIAATPSPGKRTPPGTLLVYLLIHTVCYICPWSLDVHGIGIGIGIGTGTGVGGGLACAAGKLPRQRASHRRTLNTPSVRTKIRRSWGEWLRYPACTG
jgi:hypothetical protein